MQQMALRFGKSLVILYDIQIWSDTASESHAAEVVSHKITVDDHTERPLDTGGINWKLVLQIGQKYDQGHTSPAEAKRFGDTAQKREVRKMARGGPEKGEFDGPEVFVREKKIETVYGGSVRNILS